MRNTPRINHQANTNNKYSKQPHTAPAMGIHVAFYTRVINTLIITTNAITGPRQAAG